MFRWLERLLGFGRRRINDFFWQNWAGNQSAVARTYFEPTRPEEIAEIVKQARTEGRRIRVVGNSYSWSGLIPTQDYLISLRRMTRVTDFDPTNLMITVQAGMTIGDLTKWATRVGMQVQSPTVIPFLSVGGAFAVGAHGSATHGTPFSDSVVSVLYVTADGVLSEVTEKDEETMRAMRANLGALGVVYQMKIHCVRDYNVHVKNSLAPLRETLDRIPELVAEYDFVDIFWFPYTADAWLKLGKITTARSNLTWWKRFKAYFGAFVLQRGFGPPALWFVTRFADWLTPAFMKLIVKMNFQTHYEAIESSSRSLHYETFYPKCYDLSYAVEQQDVTDAWLFFVDRTLEWARAKKYPLNMVIHSRCITASDTYLSPASGRDTAYVEILTFKGTPNWEPFFREVELGFIDRFKNARPHWGKLYWQTQHIRGAYGPEFDAFLRVRERMDPDRIFLNEFLETDVFQLAPRDQEEGGSIR